jgi:hypothetical protein
MAFVYTKLLFLNSAQTLVNTFLHITDHFWTLEHIDQPQETTQTSDSAAPLHPLTEPAPCELAPS